MRGTLARCVVRSHFGSQGPLTLPSGGYSVSNEDLLTAIHSMSARLEAVKSMVDGQAVQLGSLATALQDIQGAQSRTDEWQSRMGVRMEATDKIIASLKKRAAGSSANGAGDADSPRRPCAAGQGGGAPLVCMVRW